MWIENILHYTLNFTVKSLPSIPFGPIFPIGIAETGYKIRLIQENTNLQSGDCHIAIVVRQERGGDNTPLPINKRKYKLLSIILCMK